MYKVPYDSSSSKVLAPQTPHWLQTIMTAAQLDMACLHKICMVTTCSAGGRCWGERVSGESITNSHWEPCQA